MTARQTALAALIACRKQKAWSDGILKDYIVRDRLDRRDAALATRLCYGVLQNQMLIDFYISAFLKGKLKDLQPVVLDILRLGVYQLVFLDHIPVSAAVNESVEMGKKYANSRASGLINAVLRAIDRAAELPQPPDLATKYSHPQELVELLRVNVGDELIEPLLQSHNEAPRTVVQVNTTKLTAAVAIDQLPRQGVGCEKHPWLPDCYYLTGTGNIEKLEAFQSGEVYVQDPAARLVSMVCGLRPGMRVLDCCAAPGGKSFAAAICMNNEGEIISCDIHPHKTVLIEKGAQRLGLSCIRAMVHDASVRNEEWIGTMDAVIADVPCSGLGVIRKKPDIRYKDLTKLEGLPAVQRRILDCQADYVRPGGVLLYSTCTILKRENEDIVTQFLAAHPEFSLEPMELPEGCGLANDGMASFLPCLHGTDGFFLAKMGKTV